MMMDTIAEPIDEENCATSAVQDLGSVTGGDGVVTTCADDRLKRRAKRPSKNLSHSKSKESDDPGLPSVNGVVHTNGDGVSVGLRAAKNLRRPRNGYGRGLPKKGRYWLNSNSSSITSLFCFCSHMSKQTELLENRTICSSRLLAKTFSNRK